MSETLPEDLQPDFKLTPFTPLMQKAALEAYQEAKDGIQALKDKFTNSPSELSPLEPLIQKLTQHACPHEALKQKILQIHENFDFLKEEHQNFEKTQNDLLNHLTLELQNLDHVKEDILKSALSEAEPKVKILEAHLKDLKQKISDYELSLLKAKENFNNNRRELAHLLEQCSQEFEGLQKPSSPLPTLLQSNNKNPLNIYNIKDDSSHGQAAAQIFLQFVAKLMKEGKIPLDAKGPHYGLDENRDLNLFLKDFKEYLKIFTPEDYLET